MLKSSVKIERYDLFGMAPQRAFGVEAVEEKTVFTFVKGTWHGEWADPGSPFREQVIAPAGIAVAARSDYWSLDASGLPHWLSPFSSDDLSDWRIGGAFLAEVLEKLPLEQRNILAHSHGMQVGAFAATLVPVNRFVSVSGPVRADMRTVYAAARKNIRSWTHVSDIKGDRTQWFGEWFDGSISGRVAKVDIADRNIQLADVGHSNLFYQAAQFPLWAERQILA